MADRLPKPQDMAHRQYARELDAADPLAARRAAFDLPAGTIYLDGNSLGPLTRAARAAVEETVSVEWGRQLIGAWNDADWIGLPERVGAAIAPLIGAAGDDVICCDSTSINLYKVLAAALSLRPGRTRLLAERDNFPTDLYIAEQAAARAAGTHRVEWIAPWESIVQALADDVAVLLLTPVDYRTGALHDMAALTRAAHAVGALVVWDLSHSAGAHEVALRAIDADFAVGCGYKYLNGGPGAPAFLYAHPRHRGVVQPLAGWFAHAEPFAFEPGFRSRADLGGFLTGTPGVLGMRSLEAALTVWAGVDMADVRAKSMTLGALFHAALTDQCADPDLVLASPAAPADRGSQLAFRHPSAHAVMQAAIADGVIGDVRAPDMLRFGFAPLYLRYVDIVDAADKIADILNSRRYEAAAFAVRHQVT